jgi:hypothetical protein
LLASALLEAGANVNALTIEGWMPEHVQPPRDRLRAPRGGADRALLNNTGQTARDYAKTAAMRALLDA